jgi:hypothetical protein
MQGEVECGIDSIKTPGKFYFILFFSCDIHQVSLEKWKQVEENSVHPFNYSTQIYPMLGQV